MIKTYLVVPDLHFPFHDVLYLKLIKKLIVKIKPDGLVQLGDALDFFQISSFLKDPTRKNDIFDDMAMYKLTLEEWGDLGIPVVHQLEGNHCSRMTRYIWAHAREISKAVKSVPEMLGQPSLIKWYPLSDWKACRLGDAILHHGHFFNQHVAVSNLTRYPTKLITGHTHRYQYAANGDKFSVTLGHGSNECDTAHQPTPTNWQQAFGLLHVIRGVSHFTGYLVDNGKTILDGEVISGK